jgi:hypothetical protein
MIQSKIENQKSKIVNDLLALGLISVLVLLFFWRIITPRLEDRAVFPPGDFTDQFWMFRQYQARAFAEGRLPLWSENFNSGHPFLADIQSAIFYPISLVWMLIVVATRGANFTLLDLEIEAIVHFILAGAFTYLFAKRLLGARVPALLSALTFTFGGYLTSYPPQQLAILETTTWLPLILFFIDRGIARGQSQKMSAQSSIFNLQSPDFIAAGITLGIAALAGHPQTFMFVGYVSVIYFVWRVRQISNLKSQISNSQPIRIWNSFIAFYVLRFTLVILIAAGIASAQWLPSIEYQTVSTRAAIAWTEAASGFPTLDPLQMILPGFASAFQSPLYIGILPLWLVLLALFIHCSREKIFWLGLALGALIVSFGAYVFGYALFYLFVPGFAMFRGQERLAFIISFSLAMLAGYGLRDLMQTSFDGKRARRALRAWALLPAGIVVSALMLFTMYIAARAHQTGRLFFLTDRAALMTLIFTFATGLIGWRLRTPSRVFTVLTFGLVIFDLFSINNAAYNAEPQNRFPATPLIESIKNDSDLFRVVDEGTQPGHFGIAYDLDEIGGISPLRSASYDKLLDALPEEKLWRLLNVRYVLTQRPGFANADVIAQDGKTRLLRLQNEMPRAWFVVAAQDKVADTVALAAMRNPAFDPRQIAYVADTLPFAPVPNAMIFANFVSRKPEHVILSITTPTDQLLVLSENYYYPGWRAFVDGSETPILRANVALSAVPVRANAKQVDLIFDPWSVKVGIAISVTIVIFVVFGMILIPRRQGA